MEMFFCLENALLRSVVHLEEGYQALDNMGQLGFLYGGFELAQESLDCNNVDTKGVGLEEYMA